LARTGGLLVGAALVGAQ